MWLIYEVEKEGMRWEEILKDLERLGLEIHVFYPGTGVFFGRHTLSIPPVGDSNMVPDVFDMLSYKVEGEGETIKGYVSPSTNFKRGRRFSVGFKKPENPS